MVRATCQGPRSVRVLARPWLCPVGCSQRLAHTVQVAAAVRRIDVLENISSEDADRGFVMSKRKSRPPKCAPAAVPAPPHARQRASRLVAGTVIPSWRKTPSAPSSTVARTSTRRARATESTSPSSTRLPCPTRPRRTRQCAAATATPGSTSEHSRAAAES